MARAEWAPCGTAVNAPRCDEFVAEDGRGSLRVHSYLHTLCAAARHPNRRLGASMRPNTPPHIVIAAACVSPRAAASNCVRSCARCVARSGGGRPAYTSRLPGYFARADRAAPLQHRLLRGARLVAASGLGIRGLRVGRRAAAAVELAQPGLGLASNQPPPAAANQKPCAAPRCARGATRRPQCWRDW